MSMIATAVSVMAVWLAQSTGGAGDLPSWVTIGLTPVVVVALLLTGQLRWGKGVDRDMAKSEVQVLKIEARAEAAEARERALQQAFMDKVLPQQERQLILMQSVQTFLQTLVSEAGNR